nr:AAA family ATPase [Bacillales bacterium]
MNKQMKLLKLTLKNFKGIQDFTLDANGENISVFGDNATGKTTLFDGFVWLLFDKDSQNKKDFQIKTVNENGQEIHNLEHSVEGAFDIDGKTLTLKKVYTEKWTKKRGSANTKFSGHTTDYYIDGVPSKKKEYTETVASIVNEDVFKLLTSPAYFNEQLHWHKRRGILLEVCGDITDEEVIASNKDLEKLTDVLSGRSIDDHKKVIAAKRKEINQELDKIPVRIDEINRNFPDIQRMNKASLESQLEELNKQLEAKQEQINDIRNGSEVNNKRKVLSDIELELVNLKNEHNQNGTQEIYSVKARLQEGTSNISILESKVKNLEQQQQLNDEQIKKHEENMSQLRQEWNEVNDQEFTHEMDCECPTCGQELPSEQVETAKEKALAEFNRKKSEKLEGINAQGVSAKEKVEALQQENERISKKISDVKTQIEVKQDSLSKLEDKLSTLENSVTDITENPAYVAKLKEKEKVENEIDDLRRSVDSSVQTVQEEIALIKDKQSEVQVNLSKIAQAETSKKRIAELEQQERDLAAEFEKLEEELYLAEEFTRTKVNLLEEKINSKFKYARFKLFETQVNGGLNEVCETTYNGVPYGSGLNNAAKINIGLDIINTLSDHYGFSAPIFVDNAEAVTKLMDVNNQVIKLVVSEDDKQLRVEKSEEAIREAV